MARTGVSIQVSNSTFGSPPNVDSNMMLVVAGATATTGGDMAFALKTAYMLQSVDDLKTLGITADNNPDLFKQVSDVYAQNAGALLWIVGVATNTDLLPDFMEYLRATVVQGFQYRPRQIAFSAITFGAPDEVFDLDVSDIQTQINAAYNEGFAILALYGGKYIETNNAGLKGSYQVQEDMSTKNAPMVGKVIVTNVQGGRPCVGELLGYMSTLSVGTSIGDASLPTIGTNYYYCDATDVEVGVDSAINTPCAEATLDMVNVLGDKQYIFARTRPPRNGLWWNDGATCADAATALSTLEAVRVIASMVDELRSFFTPYINNKIPVNSQGDIRGDYKQVVLGAARAKCVVPYEETGDISGAELDLRAQNNDMTGTRTWEVTLGILGAPTLRWVDGYVSYVNSLPA